MRLVDADAANIDDIPCFYGTECRLENVEEWLDEQPTIDAEPVRHGCNVSPAHYSDEFTCSACGFSCEIKELRYDDEDGFGMGEANLYEYDCKYCPYCGAKMDGGSDDEKA